MESRYPAGGLRNPHAGELARAYKELTAGGIALTTGVALAILWFGAPAKSWPAYILLLAGAIFFASGIARSAKLPLRFPWGAVVANAAFPATLLTAWIGYTGWDAVERRREADRVAAAELAAADQARAREIRAETAAQSAASERAATERRDARIASALVQLSSGQPMAQCDAASLLGRSGSKEHVAALEELLSSATSSSVRGCAASALVDLEETGTALAAYTEWIDGTDADLRRSALMGFGEIGPSAAHVALPHLAEALNSPQWDVRYLAVESLAKLGPSAVPLLETATSDTDSNVRARAAAVLRSGAR